MNPFRKPGEVKEPPAFTPPVQVKLPRLLAEKGNERLVETEDAYLVESYAEERDALGQVTKRWYSLGIVDKKPPKNQYAEDRDRISRRVIAMLVEKLK